MRRKSDKWLDKSGESFLPGEGEQAARAAAADVQGRLTILEEQLKSQFTSMSAYHQISVQSTELARAEARADLDREKATLISLVERAREEFTGESPRVVLEAPAAAPEPEPVAPVVVEPAINVSALARIALLEDKLEEFSEQIALCLRGQEELANSIAFWFERQMHKAGLVDNLAEAAA